MKIKELYVLDDMYYDVETDDDIEECITEGKVVHIIDDKGSKIAINSVFIVSYLV